MPVVIVAEVIVSTMAVGITLIRMAATMPADMAPPTRVGIIEMPGPTTITAPINREGLQMPTFKVAHIHEQGQDLIIIPVEGIFGSRSNAEQEREMRIFQAHATAAGLKGLVVMVWDLGGGRMGFRGPPNWHSFLQSINLQFVAMNINRDLSWT